MMRQESIALAAALLLAPANAAAQATTGIDPAVEVFLDCNARGCDSGHIRNEIGFVNWVRDRTAADVHLLVTSQETGSGGEQYWLAFIGTGAYEGDSITVGMSTEQTATNAELRDRLTSRIAQGLVRYAVRTQSADRITVSIADAARDERVAVTPSRDPWNAWVFSIGVDGSIEGEVSSADTELQLDVSARRTTEAWKLELEAEGEYQRRRRELTDETLIAINRDWSADGFIARSVARLWSAGIAGRIGRSTFENQDLEVRLAPAVEYSFLPYEQFSRRQITLRYSVGINHWNYAMLTLFDQMEETRWDQELQLALDFQQPWGRAETRLTGSHFLHDPSKYRLSIFSEVDIRLIRGLTLDVGGGYSRIHDQLHVVRRADLDDEDVLLELRELQTNYEFDFRLGLSYTFGSIYNNIVNPRLGGGGW